MTSLFDAPTLVTFGLATLALVATPGPGQALVLARTIQGGTRAGLLTVVGLQIGTGVHTLAAALGLSAVLATSAIAFGMLKYLGAAYLLFLGVRTLRASGIRTSEAVPDGTRPPLHVLRQAALTGTLNPKVGLFFLAFLPQFVAPARGSVFWQFVLLGLGFALLSMLGDGTLALLAGRARRSLRGDGWSATWRERITGTVLIALGLRLALVTRR